MKFIILALVLVLASCNSSDQKAASVKSNGTFVRHFMTEPTKMNPQSSTDYNATLIQVHISDTLTFTDPNLYEPIPALAVSWEEPKDGLTITFNLRKGVKWHDGKPFTAEDVKFSFDAVKNDKDNKYGTAHSKPYFENFEKAIIENPHRITFKIKTKYFGNFNVLAGRYMAIVPKHIYENPNEKQKKELNRTMVGNGPYIFKEWRRGKHIVLKKNPDWWGNKVYPKMYGTPTIRMKFIKEQNVALQRFVKGDTDYIELRSEDYVKKTSGPKWGKSILKVKAKNDEPKSYSFIGWNLKRPLFKDRDNRMALYKLINRTKMIKKFGYGLTLKATGPWYKQSPYANKSVKPVEFEPKEALALLKKNGWADTDGDQILDKMIDGKKTPFRFTLLEPNKEFTKYLVIFQEDAKKIGIDVQIKVIEWNTFVKLMNEKNFDAIRLGWNGGSIDNDPKQIWHSSSARSGGSNMISYANPKVDSLIDKMRMELDKEKRAPMMKEIYKLIADDVPYAFLFVPQFAFYGASKKVEREVDTYKFDVGLDYWRVSP
jgi:peptide/nickel transport system substrate-binding protein/microcin C transport system substrate-binding protein